MALYISGHLHLTLEAGKDYTHSTHVAHHGNQPLWLTTAIVLRKVSRFFPVDQRLHYYVSARARIQKSMQILAPWLSWSRIRPWLIFKTFYNVIIIRQRRNGRMQRDWCCTSQQIASQSGRISDETLKIVWTEKAICCGKYFALSYWNISMNDCIRSFSLKLLVFIHFETSRQSSGIQALMDAYTSMSRSSITAEGAAAARALVMPQLPH